MLGGPRRHPGRIAVRAVRAGGVGGRVEHVGRRIVGTREHDGRAEHHRRKADLRRRDPGGETRGARRRPAD
jgi:hypothetical protein